MRLPPLSRRARLWLLWCLVAFGAMNVFGVPLEAYQRAGDPPDIAWSALAARQSPVGRLMTRLRDDDDVERYFAYAEAAFGRPYSAGFVRPPAGAGFEGPPDPRRMTTPPRPLVPWRDFAVEYPPGMMATALLPALVTSNEETYVRLFFLEMEAALTLGVWLAARTADRLRAGAGDAALAEATLLTLALGVIAVRRYDPAVALAVAAAVAALAARRPALSGAALGLAVALKGVPILLAPIFVMYAVAGRSRPRAGDDGASGRTPVFRWAADRAVLRRWLAGLVATLVPTGLAYALIAGPHALDAVAYHGTRPIQIETIYSGLLILAHGFDPGLLTKAFAFGSLNAVSSAEPFLRNLSTALTLAGIAASWVFAWARLSAARDEADRLIAVLEASLGCLIAFITLGKVFSPQYCVWLVPLAAALAPFAPDAARRRLRVAFLFVQAEWPFLYALLYTTLIPAAGAMIAMRTAWLWGYVGALVAGPRAQGSPVRAASAPPPSDRPLPSSRA